MADCSDDPALQRILRESPMPGEISVAFCRQPSYFFGAGVQGKFYQVPVARDRLNGEITGFITRAVKSVFINGEVREIGYLSNLRIESQYRGGTLLARGAKFLRQLHQDQKTPAYLQTIVEDNTDAKKLLTGGRAGLPSSYDLGRYLTFAINIYRKKKPVTYDIEIIKGTMALLDEIILCIHRNGAAKQFYPYYTKEDFYYENELLRGFKVEDFYIAVRKNKMVGVMGKWDQKDFKQTVVTGYYGKMKWIKPLYNLAARRVGFSPLPEPNSQIKSFYGSFIAVADNDLQVFRALLRAVYNDAVEKGYSYFWVGLHESDRLAEACKEYNHIKYTSRLYVMYWEDGEQFCRSVDCRVPYLELGTL